MVGGRHVVAGNDGRTDTSQLCYNCQAVGHMSYTCPEEDRRVNGGNQGAGMLQMGMSFTQSKTHHSEVIDKSWVLLDTCSTDNVCCNREYVTDVKQCAKGDELRMHTNGGYIDYTEVGEHTLFPISAY